MRDRSQYHSDNKKRRPKIDDMIRKVQKVLEDKKKDIFEDHESKVKARKRRRYSKNFRMMLRKRSREDQENDHNISDFEYVM